MAKCPRGCVPVAPLGAVRATSLTKYQTLPADPNRESPIRQWGAQNAWRLGEWWTVPVEVPLTELSALRVVTQKARLADVKRARAQGMPLPPIEIAVFKDGSAWIVDGNHRLAEARRAGRPTVSASFTFVGVPRPGALGMEHGEWWIDDSGHTTFADGDVGDTNHETEAFRAALSLNPEEVAADRKFIASTITPAQARLLGRRGVDAQRIQYFQRRDADARLYAVEHMGWVRVKNKNFEVWDLDDAHLRFIQRAEFWEEEDDQSDDPVTIEVRSSGRYGEIPMRDLLAASRASDVLKFLPR